MSDFLFESLIILLVGLLAVLLSLTLFAILIEIIKRLDEKANALLIRWYSKRTQSDETTDEINDELIAVLTAAAYLSIHKPVLIRRVHFLNDRGGTAWSVTGRLNIMASHLIKKRGSS